MQGGFFTPFGRPLFFIPMRTHRLVSILLCCFTLVGGAFAQPAGAPKGAPQKSPADVAADAFFAARDQAGAKLGQAHFKNVISLGFAYLAAFPTHGRANSVINGLAKYGETMRDKAQVAFRGAWTSQLKFELLDQRGNEKLNDDGRAAFAALEAAVAGFEVREQFNRDNQDAYRQKIDDLAALPAGGRFLQAQEQGYLELLKMTKPAAAEARAKELLEHPNKGVAGMAKDELTMMDAKKQPFDLKFTAMDGKEVDFEKLRGKAVLLYFWASTNRGSTGNLEGLDRVLADYRKRGFEIVGVCVDKAADKQKAVDVMKEKFIKWPQYFDGLEYKNAFAPKLNVRSVPATFLFDQKGMLVANGFPAKDVELYIKKLLNIK